MLHILLTFDYELFLNESFFSEKEVLIDATELIKEGLNKAGVKGTFFADTLSVTRYREAEMLNFPEMVKNQLNGLLKDNHDVQLHIHPSWYTAQYDGKSWSFKQEDYALDGHRNPAELIVLAKKELDNLLKDNPHYFCCAFRAGGFCLSPEKEVLITLYNNGIRFDSSVCCGVKMESIAQNFDWRGLPYKGQWSFDPSKGVRKKVDTKSYMIEIPIGTYSKIPRKWLLTHAQPSLNYPPLKGKTSPVESTGQKGKLKQIKERIISSFTTPVIFTMDNLHSNALNTIVKSYLKGAQKTVEDMYICAIAHPKFSSKECVDNMLRFIDNVQSNDADVDFITFKDAYRLLFET